jgi:hypothetical protein
MPTDTPYPLGRRVSHDDRSLAYAIPVIPRRAIKSVNWTRRVPIFDQGNLGSCTGNAAAGWIATDNAARQGQTNVTISTSGAGVYRTPVPEKIVVESASTVNVPVDEALAVKIYSLGTRLDEFSGEYPPDDTGSSGLGVSKALVSLGVIKTYNHAFSLDALKTALQTGPVLWGTVWYYSMFRPDPYGILNVDVSSGEAGGHELVIAGYSVESQMFHGDNSWGTGWGSDGSFSVKETDMAYLLSRDGDITQPVWSPAPKPVVVSNQTHLDQTLAWARGKGLHWEGYTP